MLVVQRTAACEPGSCDASSILQVQAGRTGLTCAHGEEEYTLAEWSERFVLFTAGDRPANGITIVGFDAPDSDCEQPALLFSRNSPVPTNDGILACDCKALVMATPLNSARSVVACNANPASKISLQFDEPQDIVSVTFQNVEEDGSTFTYVSGSSQETVNIPVNGYGQASTEGLSSRATPAQSVTDVEIELSGRAAFIGMRLCKGGGSLVGDPHVRTQDHAHYTVLNEGNFLAWQFNSKTELALMSDLQKAETC